MKWVERWNGKPLSSDQPPPPRKGKKKIKNQKSGNSFNTSRIGKGGDVVCVNRVKQTRYLYHTCLGQLFINGRVFLLLILINQELCSLLEHICKNVKKIFVVSCNVSCNVSWNVQYM